MKKFNILILTTALVFTVAMPTFANNGNGKAVGNPHDNGSSYKLELNDIDLDDDEAMDEYGDYIKNKVKDKENRQFQDWDQDLEDDQEDALEQQIENRIMIQERNFSNLPYGLSKRTLLPYGLSKREVLPFGLEKKLWGFEEDLDEVSMETLIEKLNDLLVEADETVTLFENSDYETELDELEKAIVEAESALAKTDVTIETLRDVYSELNDAINTFDDLEVVDENAATLLNAQIEAIEATLNASLYGEVQGAFPVDADDALLDTIKDIKAKITEPMTHSEFVTLSQLLQKDFNEFLATQYATKDEIVVYNTTVSSYKVEVTEWFTTGNVADTSIQVISEDFMDYYRITYMTPVYAEDALEAKSVLDERINIIELSREALLEE